jgi:hypothetical protein
MYSKSSRKFVSRIATYLSLNPAPTPAPFPLTEMIASSKFHDEAASAIPAPIMSTEGTNDRRNLIVEVVYIAESRNSWELAAASPYLTCEHLSDYGGRFDPVPANMGFA